MPIIPFLSSPPSPSAWCGWDVTPTCASWADYTETQQETVLTVATAIMWAATGRRFGACDITIRPCQSQFEPQLYRSYPRYGDGTWGPYISDGVWRNRGCGGCCCGPHCEIVLHGPVSEILQVIVDGAAVSEESYRVDIARGNYRLVRTDGLCWPTCQDFSVAEDAEGAFAVTYGRGVIVPTPILTGTGMLACELAPSVVGGDCRLPSRMASLTRQGVTAQMVVDEVDSGVIPLPAFIDSIVQVYNPSRKQRPSMILSPDMPELNDRVTYWTAGS